MMVSCGEHNIALVQDNAEFIGGKNIEFFLRVILNGKILQSFLK